jgi:hypothetical protein
MARSYMTAVTANRDLYFGRRFQNGVKFRTLCADCNNSLGGREDKAIGNFFDSVRRVVESPIVVTPTMKITAQPNLIYKGLLAHLVSANDSGVPSGFDEDARGVFLGTLALRQCPWNMFYWNYLGDTSFLMRGTYLAPLSQPIRLIPMYILKFFPLAFLVTTEPWFLGLPNMRAFLQKQDEAAFDVPVQFSRYDTDAVWPARTSDRSVIFMGGSAYSLLGFRD